MKCEENKTIYLRDNNAHLCLTHFAKRDIKFIQLDIELRKYEGLFDFMELLNTLDSFRKSDIENYNKKLKKDPNIEKEKILYVAKNYINIGKIHSITLKLETKISDSLRKLSPSVFENPCLFTPVSIEMIDNISSEHLMTQTFDDDSKKKLFTNNEFGSRKFHPHFDIAAIRLPYNPSKFLAIENITGKRIVLTSPNKEVFNAEETEILMKSKGLKQHLEYFNIAIMVKDIHFIDYMLDYEGLDKFQNLQEFTFMYSKANYIDFITNQTNGSYVQLLSLFPKIKRVLISNADNNIKFPNEMLQYFERYNSFPDEIPICNRFKSYYSKADAYNQRYDDLYNPTSRKNFYAITVKDSYILALGGNRYEIQLKGFQRVFGTNIIHTDADQSYFEADILFEISPDCKISEIDEDDELSEYPCIIGPSKNLFSIYYRVLDRDFTNDGETISRLFVNCKSAKTYLDIKTALKYPSLTPILNIKFLGISLVNKHGLDSISDDGNSLAKLDIDVSCILLSTIYEKFKDGKLMDTFKICTEISKLNNYSDYDLDLVEYLEHLPNLEHIEVVMNNNTKCKIKEANIIDRLNEISKTNRRGTYLSYKSIHQDRDNDNYKFNSRNKETKDHPFSRFIQIYL